MTVWTDILPQSALIPCSLLDRTNEISPLLLVIDILGPVTLDGSEEFGMSHRRTENEVKQFVMEEALEEQRLGPVESISVDSERIGRELRERECAYCASPKIAKAKPPGPEGQAPENLLTFVPEFSVDGLNSE